MRCQQKRKLARIVNTVFLTMGGYSFGFELDKFIISADAHVIGMTSAFLFFVFSMWMRGACADKNC